MKKTFKFFAISSLVFIASSCSILGQKKLPELDYISTSGQIDARRFLDGDLEGFGIIRDANGKITDTKMIKITAKWDGNKGTVKQNFSLSDGTKDNRTWLFSVEQDGTFDAVGHNVSTPARGRQIGNALQMVYRLSVTKNGMKQEMDFEDRIYQIDENSAILISKSKKGFFDKPETAIISLKKVDPRSSSKKSQEEEKKEEPKAEEENEDLEDQEENGEEVKSEKKFSLKKAKK